jgi:hypothetical protein
MASLVSQGQKPVVHEVFIISDSVDQKKRAEKYQRELWRAFRNYLSKLLHKISEKIPMIQKCLSRKGNFFARHHFCAFFRIVFNNLLHRVERFFTFTSPLKRIFPELHKDATNAE